MTRVYSVSRTLVAVARDNQGAETSSTPVAIVADEAPRTAVVLLDPKQGTVIAARAGFELRANLVATGSRSIRSEVNFYVDGQFVGSRLTDQFTPTNPPVTLAVTNLAEGEHEIWVELTEGICACERHTIRAVSLAIRDPVLTPDHELAFEVITAFPGTPTEIEYSTDFENWAKLRTVTPEANYFRFTTPIESASSRRWYRVSVSDDP